MRGDGPACGERGPEAVRPAQAARRAGVLGAAHLWGLTALRGLRGLREPRLRAFPPCCGAWGKGRKVLGTLRGFAAWIRSCRRITALESRVQPSTWAEREETAWE